MKSKSGACPRCRKEIPLVPDSQGDLVLETHHVLTTSAGFGDVEECPGTGDAAASLDDSEDWSWVTPDPNWVRDDSDLRRPIRLTDSPDATSSVFEPPGDDDQCGAWVGGCTCGHSWAAREYAG